MGYCHALEILPSQILENTTGIQRKIINALRNLTSNIIHSDNFLAGVTD